MLFKKRWISTDGIEFSSDDSYKEDSNEENSNEGN